MVAVLTREIAVKIFDNYTTDIEGKEYLDSILDDLRIHNTAKSNSVASNLEFLMDEHAMEEGICKECFGSDFDEKIICMESIDGPAEYSYKCQNCGTVD